MSGLGQIVGGLTNGIIGSTAAENAGNVGVNYANQALQEGQNIYNQNAGNFTPYLQGGAQAEGNLQSMAGPNGQLGRQFTLADFQADPGYKFDVNQGQQGIQNGAVQGGALSGATLKALTGYNQQMASNEYQSAYNRFVGNQNQNFGQLSSMAKEGLGAAQGLGQLGANYTGQQTNELNTAASARMGGIMGVAGAKEGAVTNMMQGLTGQGGGNMANGSLLSSLAGS